MYNVGYRIVNDAEEAEDVLQDAFISAFNNLERYRGDSTFGAWLKRIVINKAINYVNRRKPDRLPEADSWDVREEETIDTLEGFPFTVAKSTAGDTSLAGWLPVSPFFISFGRLRSW